MEKIIKYIGLDVHKNSIAIAIAEDDRQRDVNFYGVINNDMDQLYKFLRKQISQGAEPRCVYEAGPCEYDYQACVIVFRGESALLRFLVKNIVSSNCSKNQSIFKKLKGETIFHGNRSFPTILCPLDLLDSE